MNVQTKMVLRSLLTILALCSSAGCAHRVSLPSEDHGFIGYEYSNRSVLIAAEPYLSPALNQAVFKADLPAEGILPIRLAITNLGPNVLAPSGLPQLRDPAESVWPLIPAREVAKQVRQSAVDSVVDRLSRHLDAFGCASASAFHADVSSFAVRPPPPPARPRLRFLRP